MPEKKYIAIAIVIALAIITPLKLLAGTTVSINPPAVEIATGTSFSIPIEVSEAVDLHSFSFKLNYDDSIMDFQPIPEVGTFMKSGCGIYSLNGSVLSPGILYIHVDREDCEGIDGSGAIVTLNFISTDNEGISSLSFTENNLYNSSSTPEVITADWLNGSVAVAVAIDENPPTDISDMDAAAAANRVTLAWTAPEDNVATALYDIRYATSTISTSTWDSLLYTKNTAVPQAASSAEEYIITGLDSNTAYYFAIKTSDASGNESGISNIAGATTPDNSAPADITDLTAIAASTTVNSIALTWTAPGDNENQGTAALYDIRCSTSTISTSTWDSLLYTRATTTPQTASSTEIYIITGLDENTVYYFAIKASDEIPNESALSNIFNISTDTALLPEPECGDGSCNGSETCSSCPADCGSCGGGGGGGTPSDIIPPNDAANLNCQTATSSSQSITLSWTNPSDSDLSGIVILRRTDQYPASINDEIAKQVYKESSQNNELKIFIDEDIIISVTYYYGIYAYDKSNNYSSGIKAVMTAGSSGSNTALAENSLVISDLGSRVYIIKENKMHWIPTEEIFNSHEYEWDKIIKISGNLMLGYKAGENIKMFGAKIEVIIEQNNKPIFAYNKPRLASLEKEQELALELRQELENNYTKKQLKGIDAHNWHTITNSYIYGEYPVEAIVKAIKFGGKTVHPDIYYPLWKTTKDYFDYIDK
ncbi:hypothetical protein KAI65_06235 [Candidatus Parcubacteria bacterium]|nr:hypothetical protein [Candidatus Parcubacteria bacterium]